MSIRPEIRRGIRADSRIQATTNHPPNGILPLFIVLSWLAPVVAPAAATEVPFATLDTIVDQLGTPVSIVSTDINGDGRPDVVVGSTDLKWYENGTSISHLIAMDSQQNAVGVVDIDRDGDMDVVAGSPTDGAINWYENAFGLGLTWIPHVIAPGVRRSVSNIVDLLPVDLDKDGDADVLVADSAGNKVSYFENTDGAGGVWTERTIFTLTAPNRVAVGDIDGSGTTDVVVSSGDTASVQWLENDGQARLGFTPHPVDPGGDPANGIGVADFDCDGDLDVASVSATGSTVQWHENTDGAGLSFVLRPIASLTSALALAIVDLDCNGTPDILAGASQTDPGITYYDNPGGPTPTFVTRVFAETALTGVRTLVTVDVDSDGDADVLSLGTSNKTVLLHRNQTIHRNTVFPDQTVIDGSALSTRWVAIGDINHDGSKDVIEASFDDNTIAWYDNTNGDGSLWTKKTIASLNGAIAVATADIDHDGQLDVVSAARTLGQITWHRNLDGIGCTWETNVVTDLSSTVESVFCADVNGDGHTDVISGSVLINEVAWYENLGAGTGFTKRVITTQANSVRSVFAADLDKDGDIDIVSASSSVDKVEWYENLGGDPVMFATRVITTDADNVVSVFAADVNSDGHCDVLSASRSDDTVAWYENNGASPPTFTPRTISTLADGARSVYAVDLDKDGDTDVIGASGNSNKITYYENQGGISPVFVELNVTTNAFVPNSVVACDIDKDGAVDVVSASIADNTVAWYRNAGGQAGLVTTAVAPSFLDQGTTNAVLAIDLIHRGRIGDSPVEFATLGLRFEKADGVPFSTVELAGIISAVKLFVDDGSGMFDIGLDTSVACFGSPPLTNGASTFPLPDNTPSLRVAHGAPSPRFFVVLELTDDAGIQPTTNLLVTHRTNCGSTVEDAASDITLLLEAPIDVRTRLVPIRALTIECRVGTVNARVGPITDVLFVNGSAGVGNERVVTLSQKNPLTLCIEPPPSGSEGPTDYVVYAWLGEPSNGLHADLPFNLGCSALPMPLNSGRGPQPTLIANTLGFPNLLGETVWPIPIGPAPFCLIDLQGGVGFSVTAYVQGLILDSESSQGQAAVTNGIVIRVQP